MCEDCIANTLLIKYKQLHIKSDGVGEIDVA